MPTTKSLVRLCFLLLTASLTALGQSIQPNPPALLPSPTDPGLPTPTAPSAQSTAPSVASPLPIAPTSSSIPAPTAVPTALNSVSTRWDSGMPAQGGAFTEFGNGINFLNSSNQWERSQDLIELTSDGGAAAIHGVNKMFFANDISTPGSIQIINESNQIFRTRPMGIVLQDGSGKSITLATLQSSTGELLPPNQVLYRSAFSNQYVLADIRITSAHDGSEVDIVFVQKPRVEALLAAAGMSVETARMQIFHEFQVPEEPQIKTRILYSETNAALRAVMVEPDLSDSTLSWTGLWLPLGREVALDGAVARDPNQPARIRVPNPLGDTNQVLCAKEWFTTNGTSWLIESLNWKDLAPKMAGLPEMAATAAPANLRGQIVQGRMPPVPAAAAKSRQPMRLASEPYHPNGFLWDFLTVVSMGSAYEFSTNGTFWLPNGGYCGSTVTFDPGCVLKFPVGEYLLLYGSIVCNGTSTSLSTLTCSSDSMYGELVPGSTGYPKASASQAIWLYYETSPVTLAHLRFRWVATAVQIDANLSDNLVVYFNNSTIELSGTGIAAYNCTVSISSSTYCGVNDPMPNRESTTFSGSLTDACSGSVGTISDLWWITYFGSTTAYGTNDDPNGDGHSILTDYQNGWCPAKRMVAVWGGNTYGEWSVPPNLGDAITVVGGYDFCAALRTNGVVVAWGNTNDSATSVPASITNAVALAAHSYQAGVIRANGTVALWGQTNYDGTIPSGLSTVRSLALGLQFAIAVRQNGTVVAWGDNGSGQTNVPSGLAGVLTAAAGQAHGVALKSSGTVVAWGANSFGQTNVPSGLSGVVAIAAGEFHTLALKSDGTVVAWGAGLTNNPGDLLDFGQSIIPSGLSNVVAIAASVLHSMALKSDGTVVVWGDKSGPPSTLTNAIGIGCNGDSCMAIRAAPLPPWFAQPPVVQAVPPTTAIFSSFAEGLAAVSYQWQFNGVNITGATSANYTNSNMQSSNAGNYRVIASNGAGSTTSATLTISAVNAPQITAVSPTSTPIWLTNNVYGDDLSFFSVTATDSMPSAWALTYLWQLNGTNLNNSISNYVLPSTPDLNGIGRVPIAAEGTYSATVTNVAGATNVSWLIRILTPDTTATWGWNYYGQVDRPLDLTNVMAVAAGYLHTLALTDAGTVVAWGDNTYNETNVPPGLSGVTAIAAGGFHSLARLTNGTVVAWGYNGQSQTNVPGGLTNVASISAGGYHSLARLTNGTVTAWGDNSYGQSSVPSGLSGIAAVSGGYQHSLALLTNGTVVSWGDNTSGQTNAPSGLSNVTAIAAGGYFNLALLTNGSVVAWGDNTYGQTNVPAGLTNAMAVAAGAGFAMALKNDGTVVAWGESDHGETSVVANMPPVKSIAAGYYHGLAALYSPLIQYPVDVTKDLLLIYNTNSASTISTWVMNYYLTNRPMVGGANLLGINCVTNEDISTTYYNTNISVQIQTWLANNPTKRPQYVILFPDIPSGPGDVQTESSFQYQIATTCFTNWHPFVSSINMNTAADCAGYINKIRYMATNFNPGSLFISASFGGYANTNYYFDDRNTYNGTSVGWDALTGAIRGGASPASIAYVTNWPDTGFSSHITSGINVAGYYSWGGHSSLGSGYATNNPTGFISWHGNSGWWVISTSESWNGRRGQTDQGNFNSWFSTNSFGGSNYSNTPVGAITSSSEPGGIEPNDLVSYFALWQSGKSFAICAWLSNTGTGAKLQVIGDPFIAR